MRCSRINHGHLFWTQLAFGFWQVQIILGDWASGAYIFCLKFVSDRWMVIFSGLNLTLVSNNTWRLNLRSLYFLSWVRFRIKSLSVRVALKFRDRLPCSWSTQRAYWIQHTRLNPITTSEFKWQSQWLTEYLVDLVKSFPKHIKFKNLVGKFGLKFATVTDGKRSLVVT